MARSLSGKVAGMFGGLPTGSISALIIRFVFPPLRFRHTEASPA